MNSLLNSATIPLLNSLLNTVNPVVIPLLHSAVDSLDSVDSVNAVDSLDPLNPEDSVDSGDRLNSMDSLDSANSLLDSAFPPPPMVGLRNSARAPQMLRNPLGFAAKMAPSKIAQDLCGFGRPA